VNGITIGELRARYERLIEQRKAEQRAAEIKDAGFAYVLGELEQMIGELERRAAAEAEAEQAAAESALSTLDTIEGEAIPNSALGSGETPRDDDRTR
jgi:hypothetical protein